MKLKLISDGTSLGTKLIDEDTGKGIPGISQIDFKAEFDTISEVIIKFFNIPVEIVSKANVELFEFIKDNEWKEAVHTKSFEKEIKITSQLKEFKAIPSSDVKVTDNITGKPASAVQQVKWTATPTEIKAEVKKIKYNGEW